MLQKDPYWNNEMVKVTSCLVEQQFPEKYRKMKKREAKRLKKLAEEEAEQNWTHKVSFGPRSKHEPNVTHPRTSPTSLKKQQATFGPRLNVGQMWLNKASTHQTSSNSKPRLDHALGPNVAFP
ncbi:hypothetical protein PIB30_064836 [Stylosanthes scabra]|uniref:Uncharacterized protein n=1 Tax=Stylosanthes scabra TaxID=79078 RepID=A0ABU6RLR9_9FABA|nr:hypothetical protein [Stylosanthes scabra]